MSIHRSLIKLEDLIAHPVEEVTVVSYHEESLCRLSEIFLEPFDHAHVEVVGRLIEEEYVRIIEKHECECEAFHLTARERAHFLCEICYLKSVEKLFEALLVRPGLKRIHLRDRHLELLLRIKIIIIDMVEQGFFITLYHRHDIGMASRDDLLYCQLRIKLRKLFQITNSYILIISYRTFVTFLLADKYLHHR